MCTKYQWTSWKPMQHRSYCSYRRNLNCIYSRCVLGEPYGIGNRRHSYCVAVGRILQSPIVAATELSTAINHDADWQTDVMGNSQKGPTASASCSSRSDVASDCVQAAVLLAVWGVRVKVTIEQAMKVHRGSRGTAVLFL